MIFQSRRSDGGEASGSRYKCDIKLCIDWWEIRRIKQSRKAFNIDGNIKMSGKTPNTALSRRSRRSRNIGPLYGESHGRAQGMKFAREMPLPSYSQAHYLFHPYRKSQSNLGTQYPVRSKTEFAVSRDCPSSRMRRFSELLLRAEISNLVA